MRNYRDNLKARIKCIECQIKKEENDRQALDDWMNMKVRVVNTLCGPVHLVNIDEQHHCGQDVRVQYDPNESQPVNVPVQGDDCDDACCQARAGRVDHDAAPAASSESLKDLLDMQVVAMGKGRCEDCPQDYYGTPCVKVELVGGFFLCLAPLPNSIITE